MLREGREVKLPSSYQTHLNTITPRSYWDSLSGNEAECMSGVVAYEQLRPAFLNLSGTDDPPILTFFNTADPLSKILIEFDRTEYKEKHRR